MTAGNAHERQEFTFQAEIKQLLHLLSHSLYQSRDIALRELISNASDALDKMRFVSLTDDAQRECGPLEIRIEPDEEGRRLVIRDTGVGMTRDELVTNLGTIAHSGSGEFLKNLSSEAKSKADLSLIGQFGVGFYSAFMVADQVRVRTRSYHEEQGWEWESDGTGRFSIETVDDPLPRGTEIILHLKEDAKDFASPYHIKDVVRRYSTFVPHPIRLGPDGEVINDQKPIWVEPKRQVAEEQYDRFYQHLSHHTDEKPLWHLHVSVDSPIQFHAILYCPPSNLERFGFPRLEHGVSLCAKRVLVQSDCRELLPDYLRFLFGLVDSEDLPLNVSRETLQDNSVIRRIRGSLLKAVFDRLEQLAKDQPEAFQTFTEQFGILLKEGAIVDIPQRERLSRLLRFASSHQADGKLSVSFDEYLARAPENQKRIYFLGGPDLAAIEKNPNLEIFRRRKVEVLYLTEPIDEFVMNALGSYDGKLLTSIDTDDLDLPEGPEDAESKVETPDESQAEPGFARVLELFREAVGDRVREVRESKRLTDSPCCLVNADGSLSTQMQRILKMANKDVPEMSRILEINPKSPLIRRLGRLGANAEHDAFIKQCGLQLWSNALILEGVTPDARELVSRIQTFMDEAAEKRSPLIVP
ncbi:molecular chaperone HtpG [Planctomyces sp. SH-PL62]|uniref:molecular chaperone HtpG n=1 Tax=Planctomyces sp. SH-PL62 TaxID=1636152 RepID=UPI00078C0A8C|nr:molecular chaperone HtpG [Planctomyces sp. SH-PL62]AMV36412.1 Chaperone protein HtpG [Planctomyces sp. SH-PL62]